MVFGTELLQVSVGYIQINITLTCWLDGHIDVLRRRPLHKVFKISPISLFCHGEWEENPFFGKIYGVVTNFLAHNTQVFIKSCL